MTEKQKQVLKVISALEEYYKDAHCSLEAEDPLELLIATRLSAQCTDKRVNLVTPALFRRFSSAKDFAEAQTEEIENYIKSCGLYKTKAKSIKEMCRIICTAYGGKVPDSMEGLLALPGIGRKTANLILGDAFGVKGCVVVDTHCIRVSNRLGFVKSENPGEIEKELRKLLPPEKSSKFCHQIVWLGREFCTARKPHCEICPLTAACKKRVG